MRSTAATRRSRGSDLRVAAHGLRLAAPGHGGDEEVVAVHDVVDHRHRGAVVPAPVAEDGGAVRAHELPARLLVHPSTSSGMRKDVGSGGLHAASVSAPLDARTFHTSSSTITSRSL